VLHTRALAALCAQFTDHYRGFGVIFDTYRNVPPASAGAPMPHRDVLLLPSSGAAAVSATHGGEASAASSGCDADFR